MLMGSRRKWRTRWTSDGHRWTSDGPAMEEGGEKERGEREERGRDEERRETLFSSPLCSLLSALPSSLLPSSLLSPLCSPLSPSPLALCLSCSCCTDRTRSLRYLAVLLIVSRLASCSPALLLLFSLVCPLLPPFAAAPCRAFLHPPSYLSCGEPVLTNSCTPSA